MDKSQCRNSGESRAQYMLRIALQNRGNNHVIDDNNKNFCDESTRTELTADNNGTQQLIIYEEGESTADTAQDYLGKTTDTTMLTDEIDVTEPMINNASEDQNIIILWEDLDFIADSTQDQFELLPATENQDANKETLVQNEENASNLTILAPDTDQESEMSTGSQDTYIPESISETSDDTTSLTDQGENNERHSKNPKKKLRKPFKWVKNVRKNKRNHGEAYTNSAGKNVIARSVKNKCHDNCRLKCSTRVTDIQREQIHKSYWSLGDVNRQRDFLVKNLEPITPKYQNKKANSTRSNNYGYFFEINNTKIRVCKTFFLNTLDISNKSVITALKKKTNVGVVEKDKRGGHPTSGRPVIQEQARNFVKRHIESFPTVESHYCRARTERNYIDGSLNQSIMYRLYLEKCNEERRPSVKQSFYNMIFNTEYNISFHNPKKDLCCVCDTFNKLSPEEKLTKQDSYNTHINEKKQSRTEKENDIKTSLDNSNNTIVCCFDLQAVQSVPTGDRSDFYYKRRLSCYNFTIFSITTKEGFSFLWHEGLAKRGVNEIGSCLFKFLKQHVTQENILFYSDNCPGQNKNKFIAALYLYCVQNLPQVESITHKFLVVGHTQNEGDAMHALIEREKKRYLKGNPIYVPTQLLPIISLAKKKGKPYVVEELNDIYDIKGLVETGNNYNKNEEGQSVKWNDIKAIKLEKKSPNTIFYKTSYFDNDFKRIIVFRKHRTRKSANLEAPTLNPIFDVGGIAEAKKRDLVALCESGAIPRVYWDFFKSIPTSTGHRNDDEI